MIELLASNPIILLFIVASLGYLVGSFRYKGSSLGVAALLFVGLGIGSIDSRLQIPEVILLLGLSIYVYSIGLSSGPAFFKSYQKNGLRDFWFILGMLVVSALFTILVFYLFDFSPATITGIYAGSTTNTAALAGTIDYASQNLAQDQLQSTIEQLTVAYSYTYPMGVMAGIIAIQGMRRLLNIDYSKEEKMLRKSFPIGDKITSRTVVITNPEATQTTIREMHQTQDWNINFGRVDSKDKVFLPNWDTKFSLGDIILIIGNQEELDAAERFFGERSEYHLSDDRRKFDLTTIFVSDSNRTGISLAALNIPEKFNALITRIRRGDMDMLAKSDTVLELGDRILVVGKKDELAKISEYFGNSYHKSSRVDFFSFGLGIGLGLLLGNIEFSLGGSVNFKLGYAGGPLVVGLVLGALRRIGPIVWTLPYSVNVTLQQIGLMFLLSSIGVKAGNAFIESFSYSGIYIFLAGSLISLFTAFMTLLIGYKIVKIPFSILTGMVANQPAILDFAITKTDNRLPLYGYSMMFPLALIFRIVMAQILFILVS